MNYIEGVDYFVRKRPFPCTTIYAWAVSLGDGTFDIWLNERVSEQKQLEGLKHDLKHLTDNHFFRDDLSLAEKEAIAWGLADEGPPECYMSCEHGRVKFFIPKNAPPDTSFAFTAPPGLHPIIEKGQTVLCDAKQPQPGDVGLFSYNGKTMCRQYHKDILGITYLFSLNRSKADVEDIVIPSNCEDDLVCYGRVMMEQELVLPVR